MSEEVTLNQLVRTLAEERGLDLRTYKLTTLERRVQKRMHQVGVANYPEYLEKLRNDQREVNELLNVVLINVTEFFRDPQAWEVLQTTVIPKMFANFKPGDTFRAWSAGCASGEEPYSLALIIADHLGARLADYDVKIYATDIDEEALHTARHGEYPADRLRLVRPEWRERYFTGSTSKLRINRDVRRMVIFGRSNLASDAPISHCHLVVCRNVLIYFDAAAQKPVFMRLHYALEPGGVLFLGKAESKLTESELFRPLNSRWRIFQRIDREPKEPRMGELSSAVPADYDRRMQEEVTRLRVQHHLLMETVRSGVIALDVNDTITACNEAAQNIWGVPCARLTGKRLQASELVHRAPELAGRVEAARATKEPVQFRSALRMNGEQRAISIIIRSVFADNGERIGMIMNCEDVTPHERLQSTIEQLEATGEELQSANEELETTNEELQSTNEELETTNEELQSTNEELETTNEELHSLNEELETTNDELERRTRELDEVSTRYGKILEQMPTPVVLVADDGSIVIWNPAAERLFALSSRGVVGLKLSQLPLPSTLRRVLVRRHKSTLTAQERSSLRNQRLKIGASTRHVDLQFMPIDSPSLRGVLIMFDPFRSGKSREHGKGAPSARRPSARSAAAPAADPPAQKRKRARKKKK